jgi:enoyl-CoA hydratase
MREDASYLSRMWRRPSPVAPAMQFVVGRPTSTSATAIDLGMRFVRQWAGPSRLQAKPMLDISKSAETSYADGKILQRVSDGVGVITFNNPEKRNAMSLEMWEGLGSALIELRDNPDVRVVILVGAGDKAFVSGADISQFEKTRHNAEASEEYSKRSAAQRALLADYPKPTIACIRGFCLGGGMQLAMLADIRFASDNSQFGIPAAKLGIAYGYDGLKHLVSLVGPSWARLIMYTGMRIDSAEGLRIGLVDRVLPDAELWDATMDIARTISGNAPLAIQAAKITIAQVLKDPGKRDMDAIKEVGRACMDSEDFREGRRAFMEKRKPQFKGK